MHFCWYVIPTCSQGQHVIVLVSRDGIAFAHIVPCKRLVVLAIDAHSKLHSRDVFWKMVLRHVTKQAQKTWTSPQISNQRVNLQPFMIKLHGRITTDSGSALNCASHRANGVCLLCFHVKKWAAPRSLHQVPSLFSPIELRSVIRKVNYPKSLQCLCKLKKIVIAFRWN